MIPEERNDKMLVTMTAGELYALMSKAAEQAAEKAVCEVLDRLANTDGQKQKQDDDIIVGGEAIAKTMGVNRSTLYKMIRVGTLGNTVRQVCEGGKLFARRSELLDAIPAKV